MADDDDAPPRPVEDDAAAFPLPKARFFWGGAAFAFLPFPSKERLFFARPILAGAAAASPCDRVDDIRNSLSNRIHEELSSKIII